MRRAGSQRRQHPLRHRLAIRAGERKGAGERTLQLRCQLLLEPPPRSEMAGFHRRRGEVERFGRLFDAQSLDVAQNEDQPERLFDARRRPSASLMTIRVSQVESEERPSNSPAAISARR